jgi:nicotinate-nucleotide adenylyltransferase
MHHAKRLGIFGGSFDPPHMAHIALAQHAIAQFKLDVLRIIPTGDAWHKTRPLTASPHRLAMTRLAFAHLPQAEVDTREIDRLGATYTLDTLLELQAEPVSYTHSDAADEVSVV